MAGTAADPNPRWLAMTACLNCQIDSGGAGAQVPGRKAYMRRADLHIHTRASDDATLEPEQVFHLAKERGLAAVAFTDHESIGSIDEGNRLSTEHGVTFLPGIEISSLWRGQLAHVLGYFLDGVRPSFKTFLVEGVWPARRKTHLALLEHLQQRGVAVTVGDYEAEVQSGGYQLPLYRLLLRKGIVSGLTDYTVMRGAESKEFFYLPIPEVVRAIHEAHGIAVLAHPGHPGAYGVDFYPFDAEAIGVLATEGLDGVEVFHPLHTDAQMDYYGLVADRLGLVKTGGSDSHGTHVTDAKRTVGRMFCDWDQVLRYLEGWA